MKSGKKRRRYWSYSVGRYGCRVRVYATKSGMLYAETRVNGKSKRESLKHRNRERAKAWARDQHANLELGLTELATAPPTVKRLTDAFHQVRTPHKRTAAGRKNDKRAAEMWCKFLGDSFDLRRLSDTEWSRFAKKRKSGQIDARGETVPADKCRPVRDRAVARDLEWLRAVCRWATRARDEAGHYYLLESPIRGFEIAQEKSPRRPVASHDRFEALREVSDRVLMEMRSGPKRVTVRSYLSEILDIINGTGRRISAVLSLRYEDLRLDEGKHGLICWPEDTDKMGKRWAAPINAEVRAALDRIRRDRPGVGRAWLFPSPGSTLRPISKRLATRWLHAGEKLAELERLDGSAWHAYRRKWATERKHLPDRDVAAAGGWSDTRALKTAYQQVDEDTLYRVVANPLELRERTNG